MRSLIFLLLLSFNASAALYDRGNGLIYDDVLDITWLQDANYVDTSGYGADVGGQISMLAQGYMDWHTAKIWAAQLSYGGYDNWRLPSANLINEEDPCHSYIGGCDFGYNSTGEMGHMLINNLGNTGLNPYPYNFSFIDATSGVITSFLNLWGDEHYWLDEEFTHSTSEYDEVKAWIYSISGNGQGIKFKHLSSFGWAVHDGDIGASPVPLPAGIYLFLSGLVGLGLLRGRNG